MSMILGAAGVATLLILARQRESAATAPVIVGDPHGQSPSGAAAPTLGDTLASAPPAPGESTMVDAISGGTVSTVVISNDGAGSTQTDGSGAVKPPTEGAGILPPPPGTPPPAPVAAPTQVKGGPVDVTGVYAGSTDRRYTQDYFASGAAAAAGMVW